MVNGGVITRRAAWSELFWNELFEPHQHHSDMSPPMPLADSDAAAQCPVDHQTREKWLQAAKAGGQQAPAHPAIPEVATTTPPTAAQLQRAEKDATQLAALGPRILQLTAEQRSTLLEQYQELKSIELHHQLGRTKYSLDKLRWVPTTSSSSLQTTQREEDGAPVNQPSLSSERKVSSIPRASNHERQRLNSAEAAALPANGERESGHDRESGNWIYPSQSMFFAAMKRKGHEPSAPDMETIVPIHNAVNERAWAEIKEWEAGRGAEECGGPRLVSFAGDSKALTPRARWNGFMGYEAPFDRHDWVVDRCGKRVHYVIDFYSGRGGGGAGLGAEQGVPLSFYLDVRPKLNSWEGVKTRLLRTAGM